MRRIACMDRNSPEISALRHHQNPSHDFIEPVYPASGRLTIGQLNAQRKNRQHTIEITIDDRTVSNLTMTIVAREIGTGISTSQITREVMTDKSSSKGTKWSSKLDYSFRNYHTDFQSDTEGLYPRSGVYGDNGRNSGFHERPFSRSRVFHFLEFIL